MKKSEKILIALGIIQLIISTLQLLKLLWVYNPIIIIFFFFQYINLTIKKNNLMSIKNVNNLNP